MIVATAGHVDHGKTLLVKMLTGIDTDRLDEEKKRGLSIDIGFAYLPLEGARSIGFIDLPGHERFIRNALCGLAATDFVLLVVAADDGVMPQTIEHLSIIDLLGFDRGAVVVTKTDRVNATRLTEVENQVRTLTQSTCLAKADLFRVSSATGTGIPELKAFLARIAQPGPDRASPIPSGKNFRLAVDRCFEARGAGLVVTGTIFAGEIRAGEYVGLPGTDLRLRVRALRVHDAPTSHGRAGQRCALNLTGSGQHRDRIRRGTWIAAEPVPEPVERFDARIRLLAQNRRPLKHWTPVHLHLAAAVITARVAVLEDTSIVAGTQGLVQIVTDKPIGAAFGDRFVIRDQSARTTLGGGYVIDIFAPRRGRAKPGRIAWLNDLDQDDPIVALQTLLENFETGIDLDHYASNRNLSAAAATAVVEAISMTIVTAAGRRYGFKPIAWQNHARQLLIALCEAGAGSSAIPLARLKKFTVPALSEPLFEQLIEELRQASSIRRTAMGIRLVEAGNRFEGSDQILWTRIDEQLSQAGLKPLSIVELGRLVGVDGGRLNTLLGRASRLGLIIRLSRTLIIKPESMRQIKHVTMEMASQHAESGFTVANFRDAVGIGRNRSIELLEVLDSRKITGRDGNVRHLLSSAEQAFEKLLAVIE